ncbi:CSLREA domain-containing protein [Bacteroidota bacterium]
MPSSAARPSTVIRLASLFLLLLLAVGVQVAHSQVTFVVDTTADNGDVTPGDGSCLTSDGKCSLRAAIEESNALAGADSITFAVPLTDPACFHDSHVCDFVPATAYPVLSDTTYVDGETQPEATCGTSISNRDLKITIRGSNSGTIPGLAVSSPSTIRGLVILLGNPFGIDLSGSDGAVVQCNFIGTNALGDTRSPNWVGVLMDSTTNALIGTDGDGSGDETEGNLISGNLNIGISFGSGSDGNVVAGNLIGPGADGVQALGSFGHGIRYFDGTDSNTVGGLLPVQKNVIAFNEGHGIAFFNGLNVQRNAILGNSIFLNDLRGIDLGTGGAGNDAGDADIGANRQQNSPVLNDVQPAGADITISYLVDTDAGNATYPLRIEFFLADTAAEEGMTLIGSHSYTVGDAQNQVMATFTPSVPLSDGDPIVATATDADGNTSEFSSAFLISIPAPLAFIVNSVRDTTDSNPGDGLCDTGVMNSEGNPECTLRAAIEEANDHFSPDSIFFDIPAGVCDGGGVCSIRSAGLPQIDETVFLDATTQPGSECAWESRAHKVRLDTLGSSSFVGLGLFGSATDGSVVKGFHINQFTIGLFVESTSLNHVACNSITDGEIGVIVNGGPSPTAANVIGTNNDGTDDAEEGNVISGTSLITAPPPFGGAAILLFDPTEDTRIAGNRIGTLPDGTDGGVGNRFGVVALSQEIGLLSAQIGGTDPVESNIIAYNTEEGVRIVGTVPPAVRVSVLGNSIFSNGGSSGIGIDLDADGPTPNDAGDPDGGVNSYQNFPDIISATIGSLNVVYSVDSDTSNSKFPLRVEFFVADSSEGRTFVGFDTYTAEEWYGCGSAPCADSVTIGSAGVTVQDSIVATATDANGNTSEFSPAHGVSAMGIALSVKAFLEGAYNTTNHNMNANLFDGGVLPLSQPFSDAIFDGTVLDYDSVQTVSAHSDSTVDWLLVSLRTTTDPASTISSATQAAVVYQEGTVAKPGDDSLRFGGIADGSYYLVLRSRNHLDIMSDSAIVVSGGVGTHDFSIDSTSAFGVDAMSKLEPNVWGMFGADGSIDGQITVSDFNLWLVDTKAVATGYLQSDFLVDGQATAADFNLWLVNTKATRTSKVP